MSIRQSFESRLEAAIGRSPLGDVVGEQRALRLLEYLAVGASGAVIDITVTAASLSVVHYVIANAAGFLIANSWNFCWNHRITYDSPEGSLVRQYPSYLAWHSATFVVRAATLSLLIEGAGAPVLAASVIGIGVATIANFAGSELIFGRTTVSPIVLREALGRTLNRIAHRLYTKRVQRVLDRSGLYPVLYGVYMRVLGRLYPHETITLEAGGASAQLHMEEDPEVLSVLHTRRKEGEMIEDFAASIRPDDVVWDVGANLGVFALLAADQAVDGEVVAFEPFRRTRKRMDQNIALSDPPADVETDEIALWNERGLTKLSVDRDEVGTQTPRLDGAPEDGQIVAQAAGDSIVRTGRTQPTVVKIDVEGAEVPVIDGLEETLGSPACRLVFVEDHSSLWAEDEDLGERLQNLGFDNISVSRHGGQRYYRAERVGGEQA